MLSVSLSVAGAIIGAYIAVRERIVKLETKVDILMKDIDGVAQVVGTERSRGQNEMKK